MGKKEKRVNILSEASELTVLRAGHKKHMKFWVWLQSLWRPSIFSHGVPVALFSCWKDASDYITWAAGPGTKGPGARFREDSVLSEYDLAWESAYFTELPVNPRAHGKKVKPRTKNVYDIRPK